MINVQRRADSSLHARVCWDGVIATVSLSGELDSISAPALIEDLLKVSLDQPERLVLDLDALVFVDVAGARALDRAVQAFKCPVIVRGLRPSSHKVSCASGFSESREVAREGP
jgi:anti-anti-sigma factor